MVNKRQYVPSQAKTHWLDNSP